MLSCVLNPGGCLGTAVDSFIGLFPYGLYGVVAVAFLILGAILGKVGVAVILALVAALRFGTSQQQEPVEHFDRHPDPVPKPRPRPVRRPHPSLSETLGKLFGRK